MESCLKPFWEEGVLEVSGAKTGQEISRANDVTNNEREKLLLLFS